MALVVPPNSSFLDIGAAPDSPRPEAGVGVNAGDCAKGVVGCGVAVGLPNSVDCWEVAVGWPKGRGACEFDVL